MKLLLAALFGLGASIFGLQTAKDATRAVSQASPIPQASKTSGADPELIPLPSPPLSYLCGLPPETRPSVCTTKPDGLEIPLFLDAVMAAQDSAEENGFVKDGLVRNDLAYANEVVRILRVSGYCVVNGKEPGEIIAKSSNEHSETYSLVSARHVPRTMYTRLCRPSVF